MSSSCGSSDRGGPLSKAHWQKPDFDFGDYDPNQGIAEQGVLAFRQRRSQQTRFSAGALGDGAVQSWKYVRPRGQDRHSR